MPAAVGKGGRNMFRNPGKGLSQPLQGGFPIGKDIENPVQTGQFEDGLYLLLQVAQKQLAASGGRVFESGYERSYA